MDWFHDHEQVLLALADDYPDDHLLELVIDDLAGIADALEARYVRGQRSGRYLAINRACTRWPSAPAARIWPAPRRVPSS